MTVINTNAASLITQAALNNNAKGLQKTMESLSTGKRINSAADDAAGLAISSKMSAQILGLNQAVRNANDGISLIQTAEGSTQEITNMLQRMRELAVQSMNDTYSSVDRTSMDTEYQQLLQEMGRIANTTKWSNFSILNGQGPDGSGSKFQFKVGSDNSTNAADFTGQALAAMASDPTAETNAITFADLASGDAVTVGSLTFTASAAVTASDLAGFYANISSTTTLADLNTAATGFGTFTGTVSTDYTSGANTGDTVTFTAVNTGSSPSGSPLEISSTIDAPTNELTAGTDYHSSVTIPLTSGSLEAGNVFSIKVPIAGRSTPLIVDVAVPTSKLNADFATSINTAVAAAASQAGVDTGKVPTVTDSGSSIKFVYNSTTESDVPTDSTVYIDSAPNSIITVKFPNFDPMTAGSITSTVNNTSLTTSSNADSALSAIDTAIDAVNTERSTMGAVINRLQFSVSNSTNIVTHLSESRSRIEDVDYSQATSNLARQQIIQQAATAMLAQANQSPNTVLQLLKQ
jgi:flagellin